MGGLGRIAIKAAWAAGLVVLLAGQAPAPEQWEEPPASVEGSRGAAAQSPAPEEGSKETTKSQDAPAVNLKPSLPPPAVDGVGTAGKQEDAQDACGPRCQSAEQREIDDLDAQRRMAIAADDAANWALWQTIIGGIGAVLLVGTIVYTHCSYRLAAKTAQRQLRAYVGIINMVMSQTDEMNVIVKFKNAGQTPAHDLIVWHAWECGLDVKFSDRPGQENVTEHPGGSARDVFPGVEVTFEIPIKFTDPIAAEQVMNRISPLYVWGGIRYRDAFGARRDTHFRCTLPMGKGADVADFTLIACPKGNHST